MPRSPVDVVITQYRYKPSTVRQRVKVKKKVNGKYVTVWEYRNVTKNVMTRDTVILPVTPEQIRVRRSRVFDDVPTIGKRVYTRTGALGGRSITLSSFFTNQGSYLQTSQRRYGFKSPKEHAAWFDARLNADTWLIEVRSTALGIRGFFNLREFEWNTEGGISDLSYTMTWVERNVPKVTTRKLK